MKGDLSMTRMTMRLTVLISFWLSLSATMLAQLPSGWQQTDIGSVGTSGSGSFANGSFSIDGAGGGAMSTSIDRLHFVYQSLSGDGTILARLGSLPGYSTEAGLMIRESLDTGAKYAYTVGFPYSSSIFLATAERTSTNGSSSYQLSTIVPTPWIKLVRSGNTFTSYYSPDAVNWSLMSSQTVSMAQNVYV